MKVEIVSLVVVWSIMLKMWVVYVLMQVPSFESDEDFEAALKDAGLLWNFRGQRERWWVEDMPNESSQCFLLYCSPSYWCWIFVYLGRSSSVEVEYSIIWGVLLVLNAWGAVSFSRLCKFSSWTMNCRLFGGKEYVLKNWVFLSWCMYYFLLQGPGYDSFLTSPIPLPKKSIVLSFCFPPNTEISRWFICADLTLQKNKFFLLLYFLWNFVGN